MCGRQANAGGLQATANPAKAQTPTPRNAERAFVQLGREESNLQPLD